MERFGVPFLWEVTMTYLEAVNRLLGFVGTRKLAILDTTHPDAEKADRFLKEKKTMLLKRGWWFNRVMNIELTPDSNGEIVFPSNALSFDSGSMQGAYPKLTKRGTKLFDALNNTFIFEEVMILNINQELDWEDLPDSAQLHIMYEAGEELVSDVIQDPVKENKLNDKRAHAWMELRTEEINTLQLNVFNNARVNNARRGHRPFRLKY